MARKSTKAANEAAAKTAKPRKTAPKSQSGEVTLLSGGNPQIAKGYGDAPVQAYIAAMPEWISLRLINSWVRTRNFSVAGSTAPVGGATNTAAPSTDTAQP